VITVRLTEGADPDELLDVIRGLYIHYPAGDAASSSNGEAAAQP